MAFPIDIALSLFNDAVHLFTWQIPLPCFVDECTLTMHNICFGIICTHCGCDAVLVGKADAEAVAIYAQAYDQSVEAREFYKFMKTMETYERVFSKDDTLILSTESDLLKNLVLLPKKQLK